MDLQLLSTINKQEDKIKCTINEISEVILDLKRLLNTSDLCHVTKYQSRNEEFRRWSFQLNFCLPTFTPHEINRKQMYEQFGSLSKLTIRTEEHGCPMENSPTLSSFYVKPLIDEPRILADIKTEYSESKRLRSVSCLSESEFWSSGLDKTMRLYNLQGILLKSAETKSGYVPGDIAVTRSGDLVYTDPNDSSINIVKDTEIKTAIREQGWIPLHICCTSSQDVLVIMESADGKETKVVRYSDYIEKQTIQWDDQGQSLYLPRKEYNMKFLKENKNLDICVADCDAGAVVVVSAAGKFRFRYTGSPSTTRESFTPIGITTDTQCRILTADWNNDRIHILDQDGHFLRYIDKNGLRDPCGLCVDFEDNLFVAECRTGKVKKIEYYK